MATEARLRALIDAGTQVLATKWNSEFGGTFVDFAQHHGWRAQALTFLRGELGMEAYLSAFERLDDERQPNGYGSAEGGVQVLRRALDDLCAGYLVGGSGPDALALVTLIAERFQDVARQLRRRHGDRPTLEIRDEYDVQDLLHALLRLHFMDVRDEEWTPSYAGKSSRMDFVLKDEQTVVEVKHTRQGLGAREVGSQLIEDIARYKVHPDCALLVCFVYDPNGIIPNPRGMERDLNQDGPLKVRVIVAPR